MSEPLEPPPMDAREALLKIVNGYMLSQCVYVAAKLGVADFLRQGPKTPAELAAATGVHSESLFRVLRTLASAGIFSESELGQFELTPMAQFLCRDTPGSARGWTIMRGEEFLWQPWGNILHAVKTGQEAVNKSPFGALLNQLLGDNRACRNDPLLAICPSTASSTFYVRWIWNI